MAANAGEKQRARGPGRRFKKGASGNPGGKKPGTRNHATRLAEQLMADDAEEIVKAVVAMAKGGNIVAARIVMDRLVPLRRDRPCEFDLPPITTAGDAAKAMAGLLEAVAAGEVTPGEAAEIARLIETYAKTLEVADLEARISRLEQQGPPR